MLFSGSALHGTGDFAGTKTPCTDVNMARGTIDNGLHPFDIGLPRSVRPSVRMGDLDPECDTLAANLALCHLAAPPRHRKIMSVRQAPHVILPESAAKSKPFFTPLCKNIVPAGDFPAGGRKFSRPGGPTVAKRRENAYNDSNTRPAKGKRRRTPPSGADRRR